MPEILPADWCERPLGAISESRRGISYSIEMLDSDRGGLPYLNMKSFLKDGGFNSKGTKNYSGPYLESDLVGENDLLVANTDVTAGDIVGVPALLPSDLTNERVLYSHHVTRLRFDASYSIPFLYYLFCTPKYRSQMLRIARGTTVLMLDMQAIKRIPVVAPQEKVVQERIAEILSTVDKAIEQTEALIAKTQQIKAGLMHDLFTRGVTPDGQLRPPREEAPQLYKESPLGWIPKEWAVQELAAIAESLIDGPFGSNLKSEHYVDSGGVRVVRLQNILEGQYNDQDKALISNEHARFLIRHTVVPGDILVAALGEDNYPVGRSCSYPDGLPPAVNKADCFRLRCLATSALNDFAMNFMNTSRARSQIRRYEQGVTRRRINLGNLRKILLTLPDIQEQLLVTERLKASVVEIATYQSVLEKYRRLKRGLMNDLLSGQVPIATQEVNEEAC